MGGVPGSRQPLLDCTDHAPGDHGLVGGRVDHRITLGLRAGAIEPGRLADLFAIDLDHPALAGWTEETLLEAMVCGAGNDVVAEVWVGGNQVL